MVTRILFIYLGYQIWIHDYDFHFVQSQFLHHKKEIYDKSLFVMQQPFLDPTSSYPYFLDKDRW
jgi:hypothetical protein